MARTKGQEAIDNNLALANNNRGFTLIELAVVLVIIGLILGSVLKGKDLINSAKQKNFYTSFIKTWDLAITTYYDRTGFLLGDGPNSGGTATQDGIFDYISSANFAAANGVDDTLKKVGLTVPQTNTTYSGQYSFSGAYTGTRTINTYLYYSAALGNHIIYQQMPADLAYGLDKIIDSEADGTAGQFQQRNATAWPDASAGGVVEAVYRIDLP